MSRHRNRNRDLLLQKAVEPRLRAASAVTGNAWPPRPPDASAAPPETAEQAAYRLRIQLFELSRSVGSAILAKDMEGVSSAETLISGTTRISVYADQMITTIKQRYRPALDCSEGCSYCCRKPGVLASVPELLRILEHVKATFDESETAALAERARGYAAQMEGRNTNAPVNESVPCPLLVNERCSVYEVRPLVCRGYNSTDVKACRTAHDNSSVLVPIFAPIKDITDGATVGLSQQLASRELNASMIDLGRALNIAFTSGDALEQSISASGSTLATAENKTWVARLLAQVHETARRVGIEI